MSRQISTLFAARVIRIAARAGLDPAPLYRHAGIDENTVNFPPISEERHLGLWELILRTGKDPTFPLRYATEVTLDDYGVLGLAAKTAPTAGAALEVVCEHLPAYTDAIGLSTRRDRAGVFVEVERTGALTLGRRASTESTVAEIVSAIRRITDTKFTPERVELRHPAPPSAAALADFFRTRPLFGASRDGFAMTEADWKREVVRRDAALFAYLVGELEKLSAAARSTRRTASFASRAENEIMRQLPRAPRAASVARTLGVSVRSLQRHLLSEKTTFDEVQARVRRALADALLQDGKYTIAEVAEATGFADAASFSRAYKRWTSDSPSAKRGRAG